MLISISGWNTNGGGHVRPNIKHFTRQILHFPNNYSFPFGRFKGNDTILFVRWLKYLITNGYIVENGITRPGIPLFWTGAISFRVDVFGVRCLLWYPGLLLFAIFIWTLFGAKYVKSNDPRVFYILLWLREVGCFDFPATTLPFPFGTIFVLFPSFLLWIKVYLRANFKPCSPQLRS